MILVGAASFAARLRARRVQFLEQRVEIDRQDLAVESEYGSERTPDTLSARTDGLDITVTVPPPPVGIGFEFHYLG